MTLNGYETRFSCQLFYSQYWTFKAHRKERMTIDTQNQRQK